jgi:hypothetical protein
MRTCRDLRPAAAAPRPPATAPLQAAGGIRDAADDGATNALFGRAAVQTARLAARHQSYASLSAHHAGARSAAALRGPFQLDPSLPPRTLAPR